MARLCGALRSLESGNKLRLTCVPSLGAGDLWCLQSLLSGLLAPEPIGTIQAEVPMPPEAAASSFLKVLPLTAPFSA